MHFVSPLYLHNIKQERFDTTQLQRLVLHGASDEQEHEIICEISFGTGSVPEGIPTGHNDFVVCNLSQPKSNGFPGGGSSRAFFQTFTFSLKVLIVGESEQSLGTFKAPLLVHRFSSPGES